MLLFQYFQYFQHFLKTLKISKINKYIYIQICIIDHGTNVYIALWKTDYKSTNETNSNKNEIWEGTFVCAKCHGLGTINNELCRKCNGNKYLAKQLAKVTCEDCNSTGRKTNEKTKVSGVCRKCKGNRIGSMIAVYHRPPPSCYP